MTQTAIYVAGHQGMVGSAICRLLERRRDVTVVTATRGDLDLSRQTAVEAFFAEHAIDQVYLAAARVGGIHANNSYPAEFLSENLLIQTHIIQAAHRTNVQKLLFLGSSCIYPKYAEQPIREDALLTGALEPTNEAYAIAKIAGIKLCESFKRQYGRDYRSVMPTNLYGPGDNFHPENSHVIPGLLRRFHEAAQAEAESVRVWGTGTPRREFLHVDDMASACLHIMELPLEQYEQHTQPRLSHINVGTGTDCSIRELAETIARVTGFQGRLEFDASKPDGAPRKLLDVSKLIALGWRATTDLEAGLKETYKWFLEHDRSEPA
ncbi:GDP-L-fucose synthase family protein [Haliea sp.]|uniref:GDP-L-fucose synthase n=1 Tax=Haliea sp. TaxID=1932666 RepID=UPI003529351B